MSLPLIDFRGKVTHETDAVLDALNLGTGKDRSEIAREVLHTWALSKINEARLLNDALSVAGLEGIAGERRAKVER
jgi:hypothetical protein